MLILGIETSCDETAAAVVRDGKEILSNVVASSADLHAKTGGVIPENAAREQVKSILPVINEALSQAFPNSPINHYSSSIDNIDAIAVTVGPGLIGSLLVGVETAKTLSYLWDKPIIPVNHLVGHLYANWLKPEIRDKRLEISKKQELKTPEFPAVGMVVSGGHTDIVLMKDHGKLKYLGGTRDDAAGEAFDKIARLLDIPYPGGPKLAKMADKYRAQNPDVKLNQFPRPMINELNFEMSFSGLKTAVLKEVRGQRLETSKDTGKIAAEVQEAIVEVLVSKLVSVVNKYRPASILLAGGVAANQRLRESLSHALDGTRLRSLHIPPPRLCTDNATYIAAAAYFNYRITKWQKIISHPGLKITG